MSAVDHVLSVGASGNHGCVCLRTLATVRVVRTHDNSAVDATAELASAGRCSKPARESPYHPSSATAGLAPAERCSARFPVETSSHAGKPRGDEGVGRRLLVVNMAWWGQAPPWPPIDASCAR